MLNLNDWSYGRKDMETLLNEYGLTAGIQSKFADTARKNISFMLIMNFITEEEAQTILNRVIARVGQFMREV